MIVIDTSALLAILLNEKQGPACLDIVSRTDSGLMMSAGTLTETLIIVAHRKLGDELAALLEIANIEIAPVTAQTARQCADAHLQWGKGILPAGLNFGDCFAYQLAKSQNCPLLYVGDDFSQTDIVSAI